MGQCNSSSGSRNRLVSRRYNIRNRSNARSRKVVPVNIRDQQCAICLEPLILYVHNTNCGHQFHTHCLARHKFTCRKYNREYNCPLCRKKI